MRTRTGWKAAIAVGVGVAALVAGPQARAGRTVVTEYVGGGGTITTADCDPDNAIATPNVGAACVPVLAGETTVSAVIDDSSGVPIAGRVDFFGEVHPWLDDIISPNPSPINPGPVDLLGSEFFCGSASDLTMPAGTQSVSVTTPSWMDLAVAVFDPNECGNLQGATTGRITVSFE